jgi:DNA polymerase III delta subunit
VIEGDPCLARFALDMVTEEAGGAYRVRLGAEDAKTLRATLTAFNLFDAAPTYVVFEPNADMATRLLEIIESGKMTASALIILAGETGLDGRTALARSAKKNKRVMRMEPLASDDARGLTEHLKGWQEEARVVLDAASVSYIRANRPLRSVRGAKAGDPQVIDLDALESELAKVAVVARAERAGATPDLIAQLCDFDSAPSDVWSFVRAATSGQTRRALALLDEMAVAKDNLGPLWLLLSQLEFLISVESVRAARKGALPDQVAAILSENPFAGRFALPSGEMPTRTAKAKAVNSWRIKKALEEGVADLDRLSASYRAVVNAVRDIRSDVPANVVTLKLALALAGSSRYDAPLSAPDEAENRPASE